MRKRLTLRLDDRLIRRAKAYAQRSGKSLSEVVADLLLRLQAGSTGAMETRSRAVRSLAGALAGHDLDRKDHRCHLVEKHR